MLYVVEDKKNEVVNLTKGLAAIFLTKEEAIKVMQGHSDWVLKELSRIWP